MRQLDEDWREVDKDEMSNDDIIEFIRLNATFSININATKSDVNVRMWIENHKDWIMDKKPGK